MVFMIQLVVLHILRLAMVFMVQLLGMCASSVMYHVDHELPWSSYTVCLAYQALALASSMLILCLYNKHINEDPMLHRDVGIRVLT